jgi:hypothetical protein
MGSVTANYWAFISNTRTDMKSPFPNIFTQLVDKVLREEYNKPIPRKDYLTFFEMFDRNLSRNINESFSSVEIYNNYERKPWGRIKYEGRMQWKLDLILKTLLSKRIIDRTGYLALKNKNGHARRYYYTQALLKELDYSSFRLLHEEINEKVFFKLKKQRKYDITNPQYELLKSDRFSINVQRCNEWLIDAYKADLISKVSCLINIRRVNDIHNKDIYVVKIQNGRIYSSFNSLKRELRQFCTIDGESLVNCDLKSSQPYFLASYLKTKYTSNQDVYRFYELVTTEDIYQWLMERDRELLDGQISSREECKPEFYQYLFKKSNKGTNKIQKIIAAELPELYEIIKIEKGEFKFREEKIANFLQAKEAAIFIPICERYTAQGCLSVHDSLYFKQGLLDTINEELQTMFHNQNLNDYRITTTNLPRRN